MKHKSILLIIVFAFIAQLFYGQEKYTIRGEFPDHSFDNEYVLLYEQSAIQGESDRSKQAFIDSLLVIDKVFRYEGTVDRKPFLASISCSKGRHLRYSTTFIVEPGNIQIRIADLKSEGDVSGTPINDDYNTYIIERGKHVDRRNSVSFRDAYIHAEEGKFSFLEKYAQYPDVIRYWLALCIDATTDSVANEPDLPQFLDIVDLMPQADRDILLAWREYRIKLSEYREKTKALRDSLKANEPRLIETSPNSSSSTTKSK